jgi:hypothetical protein
MLHESVLVFGVRAVGARDSTLVCMTCSYCAAGQRHPQFVLLLVDKRCIDSQGVLHASAVPVWDYTRQPHARLQQHNRLGRYKHGPKRTKAAAPHYVVLMQFGPFTACAYTFYKTMECKASSRTSATEQILCACTLAVAWNEEIDQGHTSLRTFVHDAYHSTVRTILDSLPSPTLFTHIHRMLTHAKNAMRALYRRQLRR